MNNSVRLSWIDTAKGLSIILVVMMYSAYNTGEHTGQVGFLHYIIAFATPFRMPEFFLISGLFLSQVIARPWRRYIDRRVIHYFYFYALWAFIMIALKVGVFAKAPIAMMGALGVAVFEPYGVLWFIYLLGVFSLTAKILWQLRVPFYVVIPLAAALQMAQVESSSYVVTQFSAYFVFYYIGFIAAPQIFRIVDWAEKHVTVTLLCLVGWAVANGVLIFSPGYAVLPSETQMGFAAFPPVHFTLAVAGSIALCAAGGLLSKLWFMDWLRWLGQHSLMVYVAFTLPMSVFRAIAQSSGLISEAGPLSLAVMVVSLLSPVILYLAIQRIGYGSFLFERPAWARIVKDRPSDIDGRDIAAPPIAPRLGENTAR